MAMWFPYLVCFERPSIFYNLPLVGTSDEHVLCVKFGTIMAAIAHGIPMLLGFCESFLGVRGMGRIPHGSWNHCERPSQSNAFVQCPDGSISDTRVQARPVESCMMDGASCTNVDLGMHAMSQVLREYICKVIEMCHVRVRSSDGTHPVILAPDLPYLMDRSTMLF